MKHKIVYGFQPDKVTPDQYIFGSQQLGFEELNPDGQWDKFLPIRELQKRNGVETMSCVSYGTLNAIEALLNKKYFNVPNYSDRALAIMSETTINGNSPHKVAETLRKMGAINEENLPFSDSIKSFDEYHSGLTLEHKKEGEKWVDALEFGHDWVFTGGDVKQKQALLKGALKSSPVGVSVNAWTKKGDLYVKPKGSTDNHWCIVYGYKENKYWKAFDSYDATEKKLDWNYDFGYAKRYTIATKTNKNYDLWKELVNFFKDIFLKFIKTPFIDQSKKKELVDEAITKLSLIKDEMDKNNMTNKEKLATLAKENLNRDITPEDKVPDETACAENVSVLIKKVLPDFPILPHTMNLYKAMMDSSSFKGTLDFDAGNIVISPTGHKLSNGVIRGHVGICTGDGKIASNNSGTGKWEENYTIDTWVKRYRGIGKYPILVFEMV